MEKVYNPQGSPLREHQLRLLELLREWDRLCKENGITWWLDGGTLLGAMRHGGFIPWDDDLDVCILWKDVPRIRKILGEKAPAPFAFVDRKGTPGYTRLWPRFIDRSKGLVRRDALSGKAVDDFLWIDTFVVRPGNPRVKKLIDPLYGRCLRRISGAIDDGVAKRLAAYLLYPFARLAVLLADLSGRLFHRNSLMHDFGVPFYNVRTPQEVFPLKLCSFEGYDFPAPANPDAYLRRIYGDWTQLPPESARHNHEIVF